MTRDVFQIVLRRRTEAPGWIAESVTTRDAACAASVGTALRRLGLLLEAGLACEKASEVLVREQPPQSVKQDVDGD